jgi:HEAT repeat protein
MKTNDVLQLIDALCNGDSNAFHTLIDAGTSVLPLLIQQFSTHQDSAGRERIIEVIWQIRDETTIPFLASVLDDPQPDVWKQALDGLVAMGGIESRIALVDFRSKVSKEDERIPWIDEAIDQLRQ